MTHIHSRRMRCPHCGEVFPLTEKQAMKNLTFTCPLCHKSNHGSWDCEPDGTLIGRTPKEVEHYNLGQEA